MNRLTIWGNWTVTDCGLYTPENVEFTPGEIRSIPYLKALVAEYQTIERIRRQRQNNPPAEILKFSHQ